MERKDDPLTGEYFIPTRSNQKFASRKNQIQFNNQKAKEKRNTKAVVDKQLDRNRLILKSILNNEFETIKSKDYLLGAGFHFGCHTHSIKRDNIIWTCIYEYAYRNEDNNQFKIIKHA